MRLLVVADDLTGAVDSAATYRSANPHATCLVIPWGPNPSQRWNQVNLKYRPDLLCISTDSRNIDAATAAVRVGDATSWAVAHEFHLVKKIDSLLRGNIAAELDTFIRVATKANFAFLFAPALPSQGRVTIGGQQFAGAHLVEESEAAGDPLAPALSSRLETFISGDFPIKHLSLEGTRETGLDERLGCLTKGHAVVIADAQTEADMTRLRCAALKLRSVALIGSSGILGGAPTKVQPAALRQAADLLIITASRRNEVKEQIAYFGANVPKARTIWLDPEDLPTAGALAKSVLGTLGGGHNCLLTVASSAILNSDMHERRLKAAELVALLANCLLQATERPDRPLLAAIIGGDLAQAFCTVASIEALEVQASSSQGGALCKVLGSNRFQGLSIVMRSGGFGDASALMDLEC